ncbi:Terminal beta-(1-_2)-arabinofuranosyltransferase [Propionicimonas sp. T2.31MG-18]|uniref:hypothetical protein n=1 Tax=Propionicimonas sp. T2.31MG-18 TaxID=3157620 RepID=UPI0035EEF25D
MTVEPTLRRHRAVTHVLVALIVAATTTMVWLRRWVSDDGFINYRVIQQLMAGRGPIYNVNDRVEVGTSTLWIGLVWAGQAAFPRAETGLVMVVLGSALTTLALVLLAVGAAALNRGRGILLPVGLAVVAALPPVWDFGTSGLETSLSMAWLAACFAALAVRSVGMAGRPAWRPWPLPVLIGLGPLVRPDFALIALILGIALLVQSRRGVRGWLAAAGLALALPTAYEVFRMGFFACLVPNTALAKANGSIGQGLAYVLDFVNTYWLWLPLLAGAILLGARAFSATDPGRSVFAAMPVAALVHAGFVVSVGGDFMHGRFLLPAAFLFFAPIALVPFDGVRRWLAPVVLVWALACTALLRPALWNGMIADERTYYSRFVADVPGEMVSLENWSDDIGFKMARVASSDQAEGQSYYVTIGQPIERLPRTGPGVTMVLNSLGVAGAASGLDVVVNDPPSLGDAVGSRLVLPPDAQFRVGHAYKPEVWALARFSASDRANPVPGLAAARHALGCRPVAEMLDAISAPLTAGQFMKNIALAPRLTFLRIPVDPDAAVAALC